MIRFNVCTRICATLGRNCHAPPGKSLKTIKRQYYIHYCSEGRGTSIVTGNGSYVDIFDSDTFLVSTFRYCTFCGSMGFRLHPFSHLCFVLLSSNSSKLKRVNPDSHLSATSY